LSAFRLLRNNSEAEDAIVSQVRDWESLLGRKVLAMRSDSGGEFVSKEFCAFRCSSGILRDFSVPRRPQQNGEG
jgi:transposase InsO family protein